MPDAKLPKLAEGSRWNEDEDTVIDRDGTELTIAIGSVLDINDKHGAASAYSDDALAVIRRHGLDPLAITAKEYVELMREHRDPALCVEALKKLEALL